MTGHARLAGLCAIATACATAACSGGAHRSASATDAGLSDASVDSGLPDGAAEASTSFDAADAAVLDAQDAAGDAPSWTLTWSDEFDSPDGSPPDPTKWKNDVGGGGWGNKELEYYTQGTANAVVEGGNLVITATTDGASQYTCWYGACQYTSARLSTASTFAQQYGRFEARLQSPQGQGLWPAFWMLGVDEGTVGWPACGEIDVVEIVGYQPLSAWGSLHGPKYDATVGYELPDKAPFADAFHTFAVEWEPDAIRFYVDDALYETRTPVDAIANGGVWPFDQPFFLLLNVAVGGNWPGSPDSTTMFPQTMKVDWVRVYKKSG